MITQAPFQPALRAENSADEPQARALAERWGLAYGESEPYQLVLTPERLEARQVGPGAFGPVFVDFVGGAVGHRRRFGGGRGQPIAKAIGLKKGACPSVLDATGGLARDAFVLASLGCEVTLIERLAAVAALVEDGLNRAADDREVGEVVARMALIHGDAVQVMAALPPERRPEVVYLDPMYPPRGKSAEVKKEMRLLQALAGKAGDADGLLAAALQTARRRIVVKRPDYAPPLAGRAPTTTIQTKKHRFDVYVISALGERGAGSQ